MREIKFRGKRVDSGKWVVGNYIQKNNPQIEEPTFWYALIQDMASDYYEVTPETIGQYTGFKDINGKEIYEGDIIQIPDDYDIYGMNAGEIYEVIFSHGGFRMKAKHNKNSKGYYLDDNNSDEIIGNKFDNPELLEVPF